MLNNNDNNGFTKNKILDFINIFIAISQQFRIDIDNGLVLLKDTDDMKYYYTNITYILQTVRLMFQKILI